MSTNASKQEQEETVRAATALAGAKANLEQAAKAADEAREKHEADPDNGTLAEAYDKAADVASKAEQEFEAAQRELMATVGKAKGKRTQEDAAADADDDGDVDMDEKADQPVKKAKERATKRNTERTPKRKAAEPKTTADDDTGESDDDSDGEDADKPTTPRKRKATDHVRNVQKFVRDNLPRIVISDGDDADTMIGLYATQARGLVEELSNKRAQHAAVIAAFQRIEVNDNKKAKDGLSEALRRLSSMPSGCDPINRFDEIMGTFRRKLKPVLPTWTAISNLVNAEPAGGDRAEDYAATLGRLADDCVTAQGDNTIMGWTDEEKKDGTMMLMYNRFMSKIRPEVLRRAADQWDQEALPDLAHLVDQEARDDPMGPFKSSRA